MQHPTIRAFAETSGLLDRQNKMYYIGLDVASKSSFVHIIDGRGKKIENKEIPTDKDSYRQYFRSWAKKPVRVAVEAGGHTRWIYDAITKLGIDVYVVNPHKVKLIAEGKGPTKGQFLRLDNSIFRAAKHIFVLI